MPGAQALDPEPPIEDSMFPTDAYICACTSGSTNGSTNGSSFSVEERSLPVDH